MITHIFSFPGLKKIEISRNTKAFSYHSCRSTFALRTALSWLGNRSGTGCWWADQGNAGDRASDTCAALAGVGGACEGVTVRVNDALIQTGITNRTTGI